MGEQEIELKLRLTPESAERLRENDLVQSIGRGQAKTSKLQSVYYDTPTLELKNRGMALRIRDDGSQRIQTLKVPAGVNAGLQNRTEFNRKITGNRPDLRPDAEAELPKSVVGNGLAEQIKPVFKTEVVRTAWDLKFRGADIELVLDQGTIKSGRRKKPICEAELELKSGDPRRLMELALELGDMVPFAVDARTKAGRGYELFTGAEPAPKKSQKLRLKKRMRVWNVFVAAMEQGLSQLLANEWPIRYGTDPEGIHQARVGVRRLRSTLSMFRKVLPPDRRAIIARELSWLQGGFGPARDWDVFLLEALLPLQDRVPGNKALETLVKQADDARKAAYEEAEAVLDSPRFTRLVLRLQHWLTEDPEAPELQQRIGSFASDIMQKRYRRIRKAVGDDIRALSETDLHRLRIEIKKTRYAAEFLRTLYPAGAVDNYLEVLRGMQECLGGLNDSVVGHALVDSLENGVKSVDPEARLILEGWHAGRIEMGLSHLDELWEKFTRVKPFWKK